MIGVLAGRLAQSAPFLHRLYGALHPGADVDVKPDVDAALRARPLPDVRHSRALGRTSVGQQRDPRVFAAAAGLVHRTLRRLVLGCVRASSTFRAPRGPPIRQVRNRRRLGYRRKLIVFTLLQRVETPTTLIRGLRRSLLDRVSSPAASPTTILNRIWTFRSTGQRRSSKARSF